MGRIFEHRCVPNQPVKLYGTHRLDTVVVGFKLKISMYYLLLFGSHRYAHIGSMKITKHELSVFTIAFSGKQKRSKGTVYLT